MEYCIFDIETDGLLNEMTKIHCLSYKLLNSEREVVEKGSLSKYEDIRPFLLGQKTLVGHNIITFDLEAILLILGVDLYECKIIDTLAISYYLYPYIKVHGLEAWGERIGIPKPKIDDWKNLTLEEYIYRCEEDVEINTVIFDEFMKYLEELYEGDAEGLERFLQYLTFKFLCARDHLKIGIPLNVELCHKHISDLAPLYEEKVNTLSNLMPKDLGKVIKKRPKLMFKKDHSLSAKGLEWIDYLTKNNIDPTVEEVRQTPNPGSDTQLKEWLFRLGWKPITYKESTATKKLPKHERKLIPQISLPFGQGLCSSVTDLFEANPGLEELDNLFKVKHRLGVFKSFLESVDEDGKVYCEFGGFTNTLRVTHKKPLANMPKPGVYYGKEIREVLQVPDDSYIMCGSDVSGLEDNTKQHYIYFYDPEYVKEMRVPGFDPHIDIGVLAGIISEEEQEFYKFVESLTEEEKKALTDEEKALLEVIKKKRGTSKSANFAMTYNAFPQKIAETAKISMLLAQKLFDIYWTRNWAIEEIAKNCVVKTVRNQKWLQNPLSGFWLYLKDEKDRFSTLNQNSGVYVFDRWLYRIKKKLDEYNKNLEEKVYICMQYHDEKLSYFKKEHKDAVQNILLTSMAETNKELGLNVEINISIDWGKNYAECH